MLRRTAVRSDESGAGLIVVPNRSSAAGSPIQSRISGSASSTFGPILWLTECRSQAPDGSPEFELVVRRHLPYILGPLNRSRAVHYHTRKDHLHTMATLSKDHLGNAPDSKIDTKIEDEQVEHGSPDATQFIETKYAGEFRAAICGTSLIVPEIWAVYEPRKCFGEQCFSAPSFYGPV